MPFFKEYDCVVDVEDGEKKYRFEFKPIDRLDIYDLHQEQTSDRLRAIFRKLKRITLDGKEVQNFPPALTDKVITGYSAIFSQVMKAEADLKNETEPSA